MSQIVIVSGPPGSGKSSVCESLCERYDRTVHLETDMLYASVRMGRLRPWQPEAGRQNRMVTRAAARAASAFAQELYGVFIDAVVLPHLLPVYLEELPVARVPVHFALLLPSLEETVRRGLAREETLRVPEDRLRELWKRFHDAGAFAGCVIDNTRMTADQAADAVMEACGEGRCLVLQPEG
jgi:chloramphenicol 3-O-phosphotransferase